MLLQLYLFTSFHHKGLWDGLNVQYEIWKILSYKIKMEWIIGLAISPPGIEPFDQPSHV